MLRHTTYFGLMRHICSTNTWILSIVWSPSYINQINQLESVQRRFTKLIPICSHLSYAERLKVLNLQSLEHRRLIADLIMCFNIIHENNCLNMPHFFSPNLNTFTRGHPLRVNIPLAKLNTRRHFFAHRVAPIWNSLSNDLALAPSVATFKRLLQKTDLSKFLNFPTVYWKSIELLVKRKQII